MSGIGVTNDNDISAADGVTTVFTYTFFAYDASQVKVYSVLDDVLTPITSGITITPNSNFVGGTITFTTAPLSAVGEILRRREIPYTQLTEFTDIIRYKETAIERALNTIVMQIQQLASRVSRSMQYSEAAGTTDTIIETPVDGKALIYDGATGRLKPGPDAADIAGAQGYAADALASKTGAEAANVSAQGWAIAAQNAAVGINWTKARVASVANVNIASPGASIDGVTLATGDRVLLKNQSAPAQNGIYVWNGAAVAMTRAADMDTWAEVVSKVVQIEEGTTPNADVPYMSTVNTGGTLGTTAITFVVFTAPLQDGAVSTSDKLADFVVSYFKIASSALASASDFISVTANKLVNVVELINFLQNNDPQKILHLRHQVASGTNGGTSNNTVWETAPLNVEVVDTIGSTLASNQFTLPSGSYEISGYSAICGDNGAKVRLRNITDNVTALVGASMRNSSPDGSVGPCPIIGRFTIAATKTFAIQNYSNIAVVNVGMGVPVSTGEDEVYRDIIIRKIS